MRIVDDALVLSQLEDWVTWLIVSAHDSLRLPWGWALVLLGAGGHALTIAIGDAIGAERGRLRFAAWIPEILLVTGLVAALAGGLRAAACPAVNQPDMAPATPCGDWTAFRGFGDVTAPAAASLALPAIALAAAIWLLRRRKPAAPGLAGLAVALVLSLAGAAGALLYAVGAVAVAIYDGAVHNRHPPDGIRLRAPF
jgi:hypothetical protein